MSGTEQRNELKETDEIRSRLSFLLVIYCVVSFVVFVLVGLVGVGYHQRQYTNKIDFGLAGVAASGTGALNQKSRGITYRKTTRTQKRYLFSELLMFCWWSNKPRGEEGS